MGLIVAAGVAFVFFDGPLRWIIIAGGAIYELVETVLLVRWSQRRHIQAGVEILHGARGKVVTPLEPRGHVVVHGERWSAVSEVPCAVGEAVEVTAVSGLELRVRPWGISDDA